MSGRGRAVGRVLLVLGVVAGAGRAGAAPALKDRPDDGAVDLAAIHRLIEKAKPGSEFPEGDLTRVKDAVARLVARVDKLENLPAGYAKGRKLPIPFDRFRTAEVVEKVKMIQQKKVITVGKEGRMSQSSFSVLLVAGDAEVVQSDHCVVIAGGNVRMIQCVDCVVVAGRSIEMGQCFPRKRGGKRAADEPEPEPAGTIAVAGERLKCSQSHAGVGLVLRPGATKDGPAVESRQCRDLLFLNAPGDWKSSQDADCRAEPPKAPVAK